VARRPPTDPIGEMSEGTEKVPPRRSTYLRSGAVALVVLVVIGILINLFLLQRHTGSTVDGQEIAERISQGIQANTGVTSPPQVRCPPSLPLSESDFNCTLEKGATRVIIEVHRRGGTLTWNVTNRPAGSSPS
jgi:Domain of unknown function (DUF4333)